MSRRRSTSRRRRRVSHGRLGRSRKRKLRRLAPVLARALIIVATPLMLINATVRCAGGDPHLLSPTFMVEKVTALALLGRHWALHPLRECGAARPQVVAAARRHGVPATLALSVAEVESGFAPHRISSAGAMGVMQLMPATARELGVGDPFDPRQGVDGGVRYLAFLRRRYGGDTRRVAAAYNAGPGRIARRGPLALPDETRAYVAQVVGRSR